MLQFLIDVVRRANGARDFLTQASPVPGAQPGKMAAQCLDRHLEFARHLVLPRDMRAPTNERLQFFKNARVAAKFLAHTGEGTGNKSRSPPLFVVPFGIEFHRRLADIVMLFDGGNAFIKGNEAMLTAALQGALFRIRVTEVVLQSGEKEGAELSLLALTLRVNSILEEVGEKSLHQVLGIAGGITAPPNERV